MCGALCPQNNFRFNLRGAAPGTVVYPNHVLGSIRGGNKGDPHPFCPTPPRPQPKLPFPGHCRISFPPRGGTKNPGKLGLNLRKLARGGTGQKCEEKKKKTRGGGGTFIFSLFFFCPHSFCFFPFFFPCVGVEREERGGGGRDKGPRFFFSPPHFAWPPTRQPANLPRMEQKNKKKKTRGSPPWLFGGGENLTREPGAEKRGGKLFAGGVWGERRGFLLPGNPRVNPQISQKKKQVLGLKHQTRGQTRYIEKKPWGGKVVGKWGPKSKKTM